MCFLKKKLILNNRTGIECLLFRKRTALDSLPPEDNLCMALFNFNACCCYFSCLLLLFVTVVVAVSVFAQSVVCGSLSPAPACS